MHTSEVSRLKSITIYLGNTPGLGNQMHLRSVLIRLIEYGFHGKVRVIYSENIRSRLQPVFNIDELPPFPKKFSSNACGFYLNDLEEMTFIPWEYFQENIEKFSWTDLAICTGEHFSPLDLKSKRVIKLPPPGFGVRGFLYWQADRFDMEKLPISEEASLRVVLPRKSDVDKCLISSPKLRTIQLILERQLPFAVLYGVYPERYDTLEYFLLNWMTAAVQVVNQPFIFLLGYELSEQNIRDLREIIRENCPANFDCEVVQKIQVIFRKHQEVRLFVDSALNPETSGLITSLNESSVVTIGLGYVPPEIFNHLLLKAKLVTAEGTNSVSLLEETGGVSFLHTSYNSRHFFRDCLKEATPFSFMQCEAERTLTVGIEAQRALWLRENGTEPLTTFLRNSLEENDNQWRKNFPREIPKEDMLDKALESIMLKPVSSLPNLARRNVMCEEARRNTSLSQLPSDNPLEQFCDGDSLVSLRLISGNYVSELEELNIPLIHRLSNAPLAWDFLFALEKPSEENRWQRMTGLTGRLMALRSCNVNALSSEDQLLHFYSAIALGREDCVQQFLQAFPALLHSNITNNSRGETYTPLSVTIAGEHWKLMNKLILQGACHLKEEQLEYFLSRHVNYSQLIRFVLELVRDHAVELTPYVLYNASPAMFAAYLCYRDEGFANTGLEQYVRMRASDETEQVMNFLSCYRLVLAHEGSTAEFAVNACLADSENWASKQYPSFFNESSDEVEQQETLSASLAQEAWRSAKLGCLYSFLMKVNEDYCEAMNLSPKTQNLLGCAIKLLIPSLVEQNLGSGVINCGMEVLKLLTANWLPKEVAEHLSTVLSIGLTGYSYYNYGALQVVTGFFFSGLGSYVGRKAASIFTSGVGKVASLFFMRSSEDSIDEEIEGASVPVMIKSKKS